MDQTDFFLLFTTPLDRVDIPYMATGSVAAMMYGVPRFTHDLDLVVELSRSAQTQFEQLFPDSEFYRPPDEVIRIEASRGQRGHFNLIHHDSGMKADIYL
jgi:hypothetical protein